MNVLLATYNFYPYHWGGSEVYVNDLAQFLIEKGNEIRLIAAVPDEAFEQYGIWWRGNSIRVCQYDYQGIKVYGVQHHLETADIYRKYQVAWKVDWCTFFSYLQAQDNWTPELLHLHGFTAIIGLALVKAFHQQFAAAPIHASYHTPISCPKGTLLRWEEKECNIHANVLDCSACTWQAKTKWPNWASRFIIGLLPKQHLTGVPTALQWKALVGTAIASFQELLGLVNRWWVFSEQIRQILVIQGVNYHNVVMGRHPVSPLFSQAIEQERISNPTVFAFVGRFTVIKGFATLLHAWQQLPINPERELWLIGDNNDADPVINDLLNKIKQREDIIQLGKKTATELVEIYSRIHVLVVPSEWVEIGPMVIHEALACGANVIGAAIGGIKELSAHYPPGAIQLFPKGDTLALREILRLYRYEPHPCTVGGQTEHYQQVQRWYFGQN